MEGFLRVDNATNLPGSPTNSFLADEVASICPLLTPSPPTNDLINPLPEPTEPIFEIGKELANKLQQVQDDKGAGDSASSSSSALAEPACAQLLNHRNVYHHIIKDEETAIQETNGKAQPLQLTFKNPPEDYFFMSWNWPVIRKILLWIFMSALVAMLSLVIAMIYNLPKTCNPQTQWYQGSVFYEIFPASFYPENSMEGNFIGISKKADYIRSLGVRGVRLNSIFETPHYPVDFENVTNLLHIAPKLGDGTAFRSMVEKLNSKNISVLLDLPLWPLLKSLPKRKTIENQRNDSNSEPLDIIEDALIHWTQNGVDGFYLKGLEKFVNDPNFATSIRRWKKILGPDRALIINETAFNTCPQTFINTLLVNVDLVDVKLSIDKGVSHITKQIESLQNTTLFLQRGMPWVHWTLGNVQSSRLANVLPMGNATLGATLLQLMLPGTSSIFYGDEIGLREILDSEGEKEDIKHVHHLAVMQWPNHKPRVLPWLFDAENTPVSFDQKDLIAKMVELRSASPSIYMNSIFKEGNNKANAEVKYSERDLLVIQRWYPRRKSYVVASNLGNGKISADLSTLLYSGEIIVGPKTDSKRGLISFKDITLWPGESVVIVLD